jgi:Xaa-Pro aminopeptidase
MKNPSMIFGNPRPSARVLNNGDIVIMELAAGYRGYSAQIGSPICIGDPPTEILRFFDDIVLPGFEKMVSLARAGRHLNELVEAACFYRAKGVQSRPIHIHGIDFVSSEPHIFTDHVQAEEYEHVLQPGMVLVIEPNAVTADGMFGIFFGHTFIITEGEPECVDGYPWDLTIV